MMLGFLKRFPPNNFFNTVRILDVEVRENCAIYDFSTLYRNYNELTKKEAGVRSQALAFVSARYIRTSETFSEHEKHPFGVSKFL